MNSTTSIAVVAVAAPLDKTLFYRIPERLRERARVGMRLRVPLGRRRVVGYLLELRLGDPAGLKDIDEVLDDEPLFPESLVPFFVRAADYYRFPLGEVIRTALPAGLSGRGEGVSVRRERVFSPCQGEGEPSGPKQRAILSFLRSRGAVPLPELREHFPEPHAPLKRLLEQGLVEESSVESLRDPFSALPPEPDRPVEPSDEQSSALERIEQALVAGDFSPFLLHGVTGSGKTEVYLRAIDSALKRGKRALVLVPEIALTPQLVGRFRARFLPSDTAIAVLHSGLSDGERYDAWRSIARGDVPIVIGARSAVFAPLQDLGIIVVDEEHESSYKQGEGFRYHARDLALLRGQMCSAVVLLGSATPALTTFQRAKTGSCGYLPLGSRVQDRPLPEVCLVDLAQERPEGTLSAPLAEALAETLVRGEQALVLLNRRGFAPFLLCQDCGQTFRCPNCEITLTFHQRRRQLRCHYCDYQLVPPELCPGCKGGNLQPEGAGTERLEEELADVFPEARIGRMDRDTTGRKGAHQDLVSRMRDGELDILVGTQMVAKGHDFPGVTLVGVVNADNTLNFPDFRSAERTFALLTQVAGRAGRGQRPGRVFIQTYSPDHYALACAANHDYQEFYEQEAGFRQVLGYPPFGYLVNLVLAGNDADRVGKAAAQLSADLQPAPGGLEVLGPAPCPLARLRGKSRMQILLKAPLRAPLRQALAQLDAVKGRIPSGVSLVVDVDPLDML